MNRLSTEQRVAVVSALVEGCSIRATVRMTGAAKNTITKLLEDLGAACQKYHDEHVTGLRTKRVQCDEIWAFCYCKQANVSEQIAGKIVAGDVWTWTAIDADSKLMIEWMVTPGRDAGYANEFMSGLAPRLACRIQITTDGLRSYPNAIANYFGVDDRCDYATCVKLYNNPPGVPQGRYSPGQCTGVELKVNWGTPDPDHISPSYVERANLAMRMGMRRFTRLTNGFSKKIENHEHAIALHFMHYNFCRRHMSLDGLTPAMASGLTGHVWTLDELVGLLA